MALKVGLAGLISGLIMAANPGSFHDYAYLRGLIVSGAENWQTVAVALVEFYLLTLVAYGSGAPGGLFAPSLAVGASLGFLTGSFENCVLPGASTAAFSLIGMGAFFASVGKSTSHGHCYHIRVDWKLCPSGTADDIACLLASTLGEWISSGSLYEKLIEWNGLHLHRYGNSDKGELVSNTRVQTLLVAKIETTSSDILVKDMIKTLTEQRYQGMPVVDGKILIGVIRQENVTNLLHLSTVDEALKVAQVHDTKSGIGFTG